VSLIVVAVAVASVWIFFVLLLAGCAHGLGAPRRSRLASGPIGTAWIGEEHAPVVRLRADATIPASHPLAGLAGRALRSTGRPSV